MATQERRLKPGKDIAPLSLKDFDEIHALMRIKVDELLPHVIAGMPTRQLARPELFDRRMADRLRKDDAELPDMKTLCNSVAWFRHAQWHDPMPQTENGMSDEAMKVIAPKIVEGRMDVMRTMTVKDFVDPEKLDDGIKDAILRQKGCLETITQLSIDRPSVFDILGSCYRYKPQLVAIVRSSLEQVRTGRASQQEGYYNAFCGIMPNSRQIIRDLQKEAASNQQKQGGSVNFE